MKVRLGIDVACRAQHQASAADETGEFIWSGWRFRTSAAELEALWAKVPDGAEVTVIMEPTRNAWAPLAAWLGARGAAVVQSQEAKGADEPAQSGVDRGRSSTRAVHQPQIYPRQESRLRPWQQLGTQRVPSWGAIWARRGARTHVNANHKAETRHGTSRWAPPLTTFAPPEAAIALELQSSPVQVHWLTAFLDFPGPGSFERGSIFWQGITASALSPPRGPLGEFATLLPPKGDAYLRLQETGGGSPGCHLDLHVENVQAAVDMAVGLGASGPAHKGRLGLSSPGGLGFCIVSSSSEVDRPPPCAWPGGHRSLVDQLCIDIPPHAYSAESAFWSALTGWERRPGSRPEFEYLVRPAEMPLRLLLQRLDDDQHALCGAHLDIACDDLPAEEERHQALGSVVVRAMPDWTTLADPAGLAYCITRRSPDTGVL